MKRREVYTLDARGRGLSDHDRDWRNYSIPTETQDVIDVMTALGLHDAAILGTSRGGLVAMVLAAIQPSLIGAVVLNDIGPVIERTGLCASPAMSAARRCRSRGRMRRGWLPTSAARRSRPSPRTPGPRSRGHGSTTGTGAPHPATTAALGKSLSPTDAAPPALWAQFDALKNAAVLVVRGETSDLLGTETVARMMARHPNCARLEVKGEGHAPLLMDQPTISAIRGFLDAADRGQSVAGRVY